MIPGDMNASGKVDLADVILALKMMTGMAGDIQTIADISSDKKIGTAEILYTLQKIAGLRQVEQ